jgi:hypothetical protein
MRLGASRPKLAMGARKPNETLHKESTQEILGEPNGRSRLLPFYNGSCRI